MSKPSDFMVGVQDFVAVLLPGAIATWLIRHYLPDNLGFMLDLTNVGEAERPVRWVVFLFVSYLLGHFIFMLGSKLDDPLYDRWRERVKPQDKDRPYAAAKALQTTLNPQWNEKNFSVLKWAKSYIVIRAPHAYVEIERLEANSKFFRSLIVIALGLAIHFLLHERQLGLTVLSVVLGMLSLMRFRDQRWKLTELTYATAVILHGIPPNAISPGEAAHGDTEEADDDEE